MQNKHFYQRARYSQQKISSWLLVIGLFLSLLGLLAIISSFTATMVTMLLFGVLLLLAGLVEGAHALFFQGIMYRARLFSAGLYSVVGLVLLIDPIGGAIGLTLLIALFLIASGVVRVLVALSLIKLKMAPGWHLLVGGTNLTLAILILIGWPETGNWVIGFFIGLELLLAGVITAFATSDNRPRINRL
ncbi:MAG: hypothetical protein C0619_11850 [Desulfuromonas sp.]|nr:MAG: hypothetical protein C0619_11850 [Desulfuromonas sp.]